MITRQVLFQEPSLVLPTRLALLFALPLALMVAGCLPRTTVVSNPGPHDKGIRYYRPKPYLLVRPVDGPVAGGQVAIELQYLPDFSEEYSIHVRSGFGINATRVTLEDGWNLVAIEQELDSRVAEQISAIGDLLDSVGNIVPTAKKGAAPEARMVVPATNVPLGFYESVIGRGPDGRKRLYGWRYVGFAPFQACPLESGGADCQPCETAFLYGLVFRNGVMTFEPLSEIGARGTDFLQVRPLEHLPAPTSAAHQALADQAAMLLREKLGLDLPAGALVVRPGSSPTSLLLEVTLPTDLAASVLPRYQTMAAALTEELNRLARETTFDANTQIVLTWRTRP